MKGFVVTLRDDGLFEAPSRHPGRSAVRVMHDTEAFPSPWLAISQDGTGLEWASLASFQCLDQALDFAVREALSVSVTPGYAVEMPGGMSFSRPGRIALEQVMASAGWVYVNSLIGFVMVKTPDGTNVMEARTEVMGLLKGTQASLGEVNLSDRDEEGMHWCADVSLPFEGFMRFEEIEAEAKAAFAAEAIDVIPHFDFRTRASVARGKQATVIAFPADRIVKRPAA